jgi:hypothetical protein
MKALRYLGFMVLAAVLFVGIINRPRYTTPPLLIELRAQRDAEIIVLESLVSTPPTCGIAFDSLVRQARMNVAQYYEDCFQMSETYFDNRYAAQRDEQARKTRNMSIAALDRQQRQLDAYILHTDIEYAVARATESAARDVRDHIDCIARFHRPEYCP